MYKEMPRLQGTLHKKFSLQPLNSWRVGGSAAHYYIPYDKYDLAQFLASLDEQEAIMFLGLGSNLLVRDGGINATVITTRGQLMQLEQLDDTLIEVGAGVPSAKVAHFCQKLGLTGLEFLAGVPGTMGGALAMNAGAHGGETWDCVALVEVVNRAGQLVTRKPDEYQVGYRSVIKPGEEWFVGCQMRLQRQDAKKIQQTIRQLLQHRANTQPTRFLSCGSVFRNPKGDYAARLIEATGLKGLQIGGAQVSKKHANFIINKGKAMAKDIEHLINTVQQTIKKEHGIELIREVEIVGEY